MASLYSDMKDILLTYDTDLAFEKGDLMITDSGTDFIEREIYKLLITERGEWKLNKRIGCSPTKFAGKPNTREIAKQLEQFLKEGLAFTIAPAISKIKVVPTDYSSVIIFIDIYSPQALEITIPFEFSYNNGVTRLERNDPRLNVPKTGDYEINDINNKLTPNKYWSRISANSLK